jgi:hypothetical protein
LRAGFGDQAGEFILVRNADEISLDKNDPFAAMLTDLAGKMLRKVFMIRIAARLTASR